MIPEAVVYDDRIEVIRDRDLLHRFFGTRKPGTEAFAVVLATRTWGPGRTSQAGAYIYGAYSRTRSDSEVIALCRDHLVGRIEDTGPPPAPKD